MTEHSGLSVRLTPPKSAPRGARDRTEVSSKINDHDSEWLLSERLLKLKVAIHRYESIETARSALE